MIDLLKERSDLETDLDFYIQYLRYVPEVNIKSPENYLNLKQSVAFLNDNVQGLDFRDFLSYLEDRFEKESLKNLEDNSQPQL